MATGARKPTPAVRAAIYVVFLVVAAVSLCVPLYNRADPSLGGIPFFYWFQVAWILVSAAATAVAYRAGL